MTSFSPILTFVTFCALWRVWDGGDHAPGSISGRGSFRVSVLVGALLAYLTPALFPVAGWWSILWAVGLAAPAVVAIARGFDDWNSPSMVLHFWPALGSAVASWPMHSLGFVGNPFWPTVAYLAILAMAGSVYPLVFVAGDSFFSGRGHLATRLCEGISGACVLGGLVLFI